MLIRLANAPLFFMRFAHLALTMESISFIITFVGTRPDALIFQEGSLIWFSP